MQITVEETDTYITVRVAVEFVTDRNFGHKAAAAARKVATGKIWRRAAERAYINGVDTRTYTYLRGPSKADLAAERAANAEAELNARIRAEVEREREKIERLGCGRHTTAWHLIGSAEDNADDTSREEGFERHSDRWYSVLLSSYGLDEYYGYGDLVYTRNIGEDIENGLIEAL